MIEHDSSKPADLAGAVVSELNAGRPVALGFECPLFVPVPTAEMKLGARAAARGTARGPQVLEPVP